MGQMRRAGKMRRMNPAPAPTSRSYLFVPGDRPERFDKAWGSAADEVIFDLEDAVAPAHKARARDAIAGWLDRARPVWLRVNAVDTEWFADDLRLASEPGVAGVMLSKAEAIPGELTTLHQDRGVAVIALIETALGLAHARELATAPAVQRLAFGSLDFQADLGIEGDDDALLFFRSQLVWQSRLAGLAPPVDGVTVAIGDAAMLTGDARRARRLGFGAKLCIHPGQLEAVHAAFAPDDAQRAWAQRVLATVEAGGSGAVALDGRMVDRPVALRAQRIAATPAGGPPARLQTARLEAARLSAR